MADILIKSMSEGYAQILHHIILRGRKVSPRGQETLEIPEATIRLTDPTRALPLGVNRGLNTKFAAVESLQILAGVSDPVMLEQVNPRMAQFKNAGTLHGAYGPRLRPQIPAVIRKLREDPSTRQALAVIWDPARDLYDEGIRDLPCTSVLNFQIRDEKLELHVNMRSNDAWLGLAYDAFCFTQLQLAVAAFLQVEPGDYWHHATSLHVYTRDLDAIKKLHLYDGSGDQVGALIPSAARTSWRNWREWYEDLLNGELVYGGDNLKREPDRWYIERLPSCAQS